MSHVLFIRDAFDRAGVIPGFSQLDPDQLFELLLALPLRDAKGSMAKSVYRAILDHFDAAQISGSCCATVLSSAEPCGARRLSRSVLSGERAMACADSEDIPATLCRKLKIVALPKRSGPQKVQALFGVRVAGAA